MAYEVASISKSSNVRIRIALDEFKGRRVIDIRVYAKPAGGDGYIATRKGITCVVERIPELLEALTRAAELCQDEKALKRAISRDTDQIA